VVRTLMWVAEHQLPTDCTSTLTCVRPFGFYYITRREVGVWLPVFLLYIVSVVCVRSV